MKSSPQDTAEGKWHKVKGKIKQVAGKAVGNRDLEAEGKDENEAGGHRRQSNFSGCNPLRRIHRAFLFIRQLFCDSLSGTP